MVSVRQFVIGAIVLGLAGAALPAAASDVALDPTFSGDGKVLVGDRGAATLSLARAAGDVYLAGSQQVGDHYVPFVSRLDDNGALDPTFSGDGLRQLSSVRGKFWTTGLTVDPAGRALLVAQSRQRTVIARFTPQGDLDATFSSDGMREFAGGASTIYLFPRIIVDSQGRIVVAAMNLLKDSGSDVVIRRLMPSGANDPAWSGDGAKTINKGATDWIDALAVDANDHVLLGSETGGKSPASVYRFRPNGSPDQSFSDDGVATFRFQPHLNTFPLGIEISAGDEITVAAASCCQSGGTTYGAARLLPNGDFDRAYGDGGVLGLSCLQCSPTWGDVDGGRVAIVIDPYQESGMTRLARINSDGTTIEHQSVDIDPANDFEPVYPVEIDGQRTLVGGYANHHAFVARLP